MILSLTALYILGILLMMQNIEKALPTPPLFGLSEDEFNRQLNKATSGQIIAAMFWWITCIVWLFVWLSQNDYSAIRKIWRYITTSVYWLASWPVYVGIAAYFVVALMFAWVVALVTPVEEMG